jgi:leader peptidase (prepilin peptidase)/N-methyltransferase
MEPVLFFLLGLPVAFAANHLIQRLTDYEEDDDQAEGEEGARIVAKRLPWHAGAWPGRVRLLAVVSLPFLIAVAGWRFDPLQAVAVSLLVAALVICTATDLLRFRVPNAVTYPGVVLALAAALLLPDSDFVAAAAAAIIGGFAFLVMAIITRGGIGLGDVKLAVLIGAGLGFPGAYQALALGIIAAGVVILGLFLVGLVGRRQAVPYAPFLALAAVVVVLTQGAAFAPL